MDVIKQGFTGELRFPSTRPHVVMCETVYLASSSNFEPTPLQQLLSTKAEATTQL